MRQSSALSSRLKKVGGGGCLTRDSLTSEGDLTAVMRRILEYASSIALKDSKHAVMWRPTVSLFECQENMKAVYGDDYPQPNPSNTARSMRPDGGILYIVDKTTLKWKPLLITEDKIQGTNDQRHAEGKCRQATGNAIERAAKNIRGMEMLLAGPDCPFFPYVIFAAGCDFHPSETIGQRLEMMNYGLPNYIFEVKTADANIMPQLQEVLDTHNCKKKFGGKCAASIFVKTHKWNSAPHGCSNWGNEERYAVCKWVVDQTLAPYV